MYKKFIKRLIDLVISLLALPFLVIIVVVIGLLIYLEDRGSVFYISQRLGKDGKIFRMYKFRSMKMNAPDIRNSDGSTFNSENDERLSKIGRFIRKTSIDELPQFLNVLIGDMSLIGPRPSLPDALSSYDEHSKKKFEVKPGITGYTQAYYRNSISLKEKVENDIYYIQNMSFKMDFKIFLRSIVNVISRRNVYGTKSSEKINNDIGVG